MSTVLMSSVVIWLLVWLGIGNSLLKKGVFHAKKDNRNIFVEKTKFFLQNPLTKGYESSIIAKLSKSGREQEEKDEKRKTFFKKPLDKAEWK